MKQEDRLGKLGTLVREAQSERPKKERQSGVVKVDGRLLGGVLARWARTGGVTKI